MTVKPVRALEGELVEVIWTCADGTTFYQRVTIPPKAHRQAQVWAEQQVAERRQAALGLDARTPEPPPPDPVATPN